jgi:mycothiol synthase
VQVADTLTPADQDALAAVVEAATSADGVVPLSEHALLHLRTGAGAGSRHLVVRAPSSAPSGAGLLPQSPHGRVQPGSGTPAGDLVAVAHVDLEGDTGPASAELAVRPERRGEGLGSALLRAVEALAGTSPLRVWAHGDLPAARALAAARGYRPVRELWQMNRSLADPLPAVEVPAGFTLRAFRPGVDDESWLAVNAAAFAHHPEQGGLTRTGLEDRMAEPWFDPAGFFVATRGDELVGFHWTKVHTEADPPFGEVYVVGVAPSAQGGGLGKRLTLAGLTHLASLGLDQVILYVEADNGPAVAIYERLGFRHAPEDTHVQYARP